ncbi:MAG TPA: T9SS type A sorting domain-containing protein, partial [Bacteroidia bacterium]|nr:T9SS type A sorting domain-containing protein [Bacteroidia bacterium]
PGSVCKSQTSVLYSSSSVPGTISYHWYATNGVIPTPQGNGSSALVNFTTGTANSTILTVKAENLCGLSLPLNKSVSINTNCRLESTDLDAGRSFELYPNPTSQDAVLKFIGKNDGQVVVEVYQINGSRTSILFDRFVKANEEHRIDIESSTWTPGVYFLSVSKDDKTTVQKFFVIKKQ